MIEIMWAYESIRKQLGKPADIAFKKLKAQFDGMRLSS
jgi:hypothetical protein